MSLNWLIDPIVDQYADFSGRTSRQQFWMFQLYFFIGLVVLDFAAEFLHLEVLVSIAILAVILPALAITARRLHDAGRSGWWQLIGFIPFIGPIVLIVLLCLQGDAEDNQYGAPVGIVVVMDGAADAPVRDAVVMDVTATVERDLETPARPKESGLDDQPKM